MEKITVISPGTDLNTVIESGLYRLQGDESTFANGPDFNYGWNIMLVGGYLDTTFQEIHGLRNEIAIRMRTSSVNWSSWAGLATATAPAVYDLPLAAGITATDAGCKYFKTQDHVCTIAVDCVMPNNGLTSEGVIFTLPEGYRPAQYIIIPAIAVTTDGGTYCASLRIWENGIAKIWMPVVHANQFIAHASFIAS